MCTHTCILIPIDARMPFVDYTMLVLKCCQSGINYLLDRPYE